MSTLLEAVLFVTVGVGGFLIAQATTTSRHQSGSRLVATPGFTVKINGVNLEPTLEPGEKISATIDFVRNGLVRGEIVVFNKPADDAGPGVTNVVDRTLGLPRETISARGARSTSTESLYGSLGSPRPSTTPRPISVQRRYLPGSISSSVTTVATSATLAFLDRSPAM
jgi:hypothetical protein